MITGGDYLFDPASGNRYSKDDDHIAQIIELVGEFPKTLAFSGKYSSEFFNRKGEIIVISPFDFTRLTMKYTGELRHIQKLRFWPLDAVLHDKYLLPREQADMIASFLTPMLRLHPDKRAKASELVHHQWLDGILVQGELALIRRAEEEDLRRKEAAARRAGGEGAAGSELFAAESMAKLAKADERYLIEEQNDMDALKPVDSSLDVEDGRGASSESGGVVPSTAHGKENALRSTSRKTSSTTATATVDSPNRHSSAKKRT